jgi:hypothetical protein
MRANQEPLLKKLFQKSATSKHFRPAASFFLSSKFRKRTGICFRRNSWTRAERRPGLCHGTPSWIASWTWRCRSRAWTTGLLSCPGLKRPQCLHLGTPKSITRYLLVLVWPPIEPHCLMTVHDHLDHWQSRGDLTSRQESLSLCTLAWQVSRDMDCFCFYAIWVR